MLRAVSIWALASSAFILILTGSKIAEILDTRRSSHTAQELDLSRAEATGSFLKAVTLRNCSLTTANNTLERTLERLDRIKSSDGYEGWVRAVEQAERAALSALSCAPTNGYYWARFAMIRQSQVEIADEVRVLMGLSQTFAPVELNAVNARLSLSNQVSIQTQREIFPILEADRAVMCRYRWSQKMVVRPNADLTQHLGSEQSGDWCRR